MDDVSNLPEDDDGYDVAADPKQPEPNYRRTTIIFTKEDSKALDDLVKGANQRNWDNPSRSSIVRALVRMASEGMNSRGELTSPIGSTLDVYLPPHLTNISQTALKPGPPKGTKPPKRLR